MKVRFTDFNPNTPIKDRYEYVIDYISHEFDLEFDNAFYLIKQLKHNQSSVMVYAEVIADFHIFDNALHIQIDGAGFWCADNIDLEAANEILRMVYNGCEDFGKYIPNTNREWGAWTP